MGLFQLRGAFFNDRDVAGYVIQENVPIETFSVSFESTRISNNMVKLPAQR